MDFKTNIINTEDGPKVNCIGYFQGDYFSIESLIKRQKMIYDYLKSKEVKDQEFVNMYNATERMRVALLNFNK